MSHDAAQESATAGDRNLVHVRISACGGYLDVEVVLSAPTTLELPKDHQDVKTDELHNLSGYWESPEYRHFTSPHRPQGFFHVTHTIGERIEFGVYTPGENHNNALTRTLLDCFAVADRARIEPVLIELAAARQKWWDVQLARIAAELGKSVSELTDADRSLLMTVDGHRNYPLFDRTPNHDNYPAFVVDRDHLEAQLQLLLARLLDEATPAT